MKKIFTLIMAVAAVTAAHAAQFELLFDGTPVVDESTYVRGYVITEQDADLTTYELSSGLSLQGNVGDIYTVYVKTDEPILVCPFGSCFNLKAGEDTAITGILDTEVKDLEIHTSIEVEGAHNPSDVIKPIHLEVEVYPAGSMFLSKYVKVNILNVPQSEIGSVANVNASRDAIAMIDGRTLGFYASKPADLNLYDASGKKAYSATLSGAGSIKLSKLAPGVYIYRFNDQKGKILVK